MKNHIVYKIVFTICWVLVVATGCSSFKGHNDATPPKQPASTASAASHHGEIKGVDVSKYQGTVNFDQVKAAGIHYVFIRATEGITYQDPDYKNNHQKAKAAGLRVGAYHFYETDDNPKAQLENFKSWVTLGQGDMAPVIDIEKLHQKDDKDLIANLLIFLNGLETHYGIKPIVYTGENFANEYIFALGHYPLWLAQYQVKNPKVPDGWHGWDFWQWSQSGTIDGIKGTVDLDRFNGDRQRFKFFLIK
jgi:lysozyme